MILKLDNPLLAYVLKFFGSCQANVYTDEDGNTLQTENAMWSLSSSDGSNVLTIKNNKIYNLPSAGGPGIYGFTISGVAILATALLLFIKNKRREEEAKRS